MKNKNSTTLKNYIDSKAAEAIANWIVDTECEFKITKSRSSKFGDYRPPYRNKGHRISVNGDLNPHAFLITTVHEFAHLKTWKEHKNRVKPHGLEWKNNFKELMTLFIEQDVFPTDVKDALLSYLKNPKASSGSDINLMRTLNRYNESKVAHFTVETIPHEAVFSLKNGRSFIKGEKLRKRFRCIEVETRRVYLFNPLAEVIFEDKKIES